MEKVFWYQTAAPDRYALLKEFAKENRRHPTTAEAILWRHLTRNETGQKWRRQHVIGDYIADFVCLSEMLIIEVDGAYHTEPLQREDDERRTHHLQQMGFHVIRFTNEEILCNIEEVIEKIKAKTNNV
ncbi:MAG: endonuclease domain-containing protein [Bacteroidaceae bacterium]|nr:endonuclease domain-containing protein [Bacteroidaceae bacterium]MBQ2519385.1 endonuclease domain-containing protein [Bacteroidaceae bacterium]MBQ3992884.1 endonuclease domain-containing protein [Bacteroidaceae bacterium]MBQ4002801.1 endonuclease domain-containing protein [Bacteroidaceae bacterium]